MLHSIAPPRSYRELVELICWCMVRLQTSAAYERGSLQRFSMPWLLYRVEYRVRGVVRSRDDDDQRGGGYSWHLGLSWDITSNLEQAQPYPYPAKKSIVFSFIVSRRRDSNHPYTQTQHHEDSRRWFRWSRARSRMEACSVSFR